MFCPKGPNGQNMQKCLTSGQCSHQRADSSPSMSKTYLNNCNNNPSTDPIVDRTPCGSATMTPKFDESYETPPYIRWQQDFHYLINDEEGVQLFQTYLKSECLEHLLDFWFACEGLKNNETEDKEIIKKLVNIIYKKFIRNSKIIQLTDKVRFALKQALTSDVVNTQSVDPKYDRHIFDSAQNEIEEQFKLSIYVNFLRSDIYLNYYQSNAFPNTSLRSATNASFHNNNDNNSTNDSSGLMESNLDTQYNYEVLPTVDEESELQTTESSDNRSTSNSYLRSQNKFQSIPVNPCHNLMSSGSNDTLRRGINKILSQRSVDNMSSRVSTESHPLSPNNTRINTAYQSYQSYLRSKSMSNPPNPYHVKYATVLQTSARDSEVQSISSHSTNDSMSCMSGHDGNDSIGVRTKKQNIAIKHNAKINSNANNMIANNLTLQRPMKTMPANANEAANPDVFAPKLIQKLLEVKRELDSTEKSDKKLKEMLHCIVVTNDSNTSKSNANNARHLSTNASESSTTTRPNKTIKEVLKEKVAENKLDFCSPEDNDQEILDKHFAQVFSETPNETPTDSIVRCVSPPKHNFRPFDHRMTPPISGGMGAPFDSSQVGVTVKYSTETIPYRLTLTGPHITLRKFKQQIPCKRGNWQYYFKRKSDDKEYNHVFEKISDDNVLLPLIDGKIFAELQESN